MKFENTQVFNFEGALRGMRNPKNSWGRSDSDFSDNCYEEGQETCENCKYFDGFGKACIPKIGENDMKLAQTLIRAGSEHRKFMRQIMVCVDITAPLYWFKEMDTYKVGTVANSTSTMHKLASTPITKECFEMDDYEESIAPVDALIMLLENLRQQYLRTQDKRYWKELIRWLPEGWLQKRTMTMNYENLLSMYRQRNAHKLSEWKDSFCGWIASLPYANELILLQ